MIKDRGRGRLQRSILHEKRRKPDQERQISYTDPAAARRRSNVAWASSLYQEITAHGPVKSATRDCLKNRCRTQDESLCYVACRPWPAPLKSLSEQHWGSPNEANKSMLPSDRENCLSMIHSLHRNGFY